MTKEVTIAGNLVPRVRGRDPFNQNSNRSDRETWSTSKGGPVFSKRFRLDRTDPLSFGPKFPEILVEWIAPRVALSSGTGNGNLWDNPFQLEFSLADHLSMSSRTRSQKKKTGGKESAERVFKLLLSVINQIFCS